MQTVKENALNIGSLGLKSKTILAPMAGITDTVLRQLVRKFNPNCLLVTEMLSSEAILMNKQEQNVLKFTEKEYPLSFQVSGHKPDIMSEAVKRIEDKATLIDINMGCPAPKIVKNGDGSKLMTDVRLASSIITAVKNSVKKPVTVKCRLGWDVPSKNHVEFAKMVEDSGADAIIVHGRTRTQMYSGVADWHAIAEVKKAVSIPVIGNGDIDSVESTIECLKISNCDGVAIARGALGDPALFSRIDHYFETGEILPMPSISEKISLLKEHYAMEVAFRGEINGLRYMRKFYAWYIKKVRNAAKYRFDLVRCDNFADVERILDEIEKTNS